MKNTLVESYYKAQKENDAKIKKNKITCIDKDLWEMILASCRYFCNGRTIAAAMFPEVIIRRFFNLLSLEQKKKLSSDIYMILPADAPYDEYRNWLKFAKALDSSCHKVLKFKNGESHTVFEVDDKYIPYELYLKNPLQEIYLNKKLIARGKNVK